ncbi:RING-H2 zinc finger protein (macronuclear) [Tetrahymena thermophila SB210]|uniref:RING-H2 zinc finger protein n=1 Tax=Tetrahymena thermophila (strain SB210) TaxID=312017 RepID=W7X2L3_TETTS|nr:RING-H2 zinc finger protein [Tetrahymena thermophila SB210]EWS73495.1 RING-H2 zinc finger protein [Tetrahymena thermophila SB210]|eukprot:XP_012653977.1 RING-H2 zinc finger protein [Tetrahymena thermophila SB210]
MHCKQILNYPQINNFNFKLGYNRIIKNKWLLHLILVQIFIRIWVIHDLFNLLMINQEGLYGIQQSLYQIKRYSWLSNQLRGQQPVVNNQSNLQKNELNFLSKIQIKNNLISEIRQSSNFFIFRTSIKQLLIMEELVQMEIDLIELKKQSNQSCALAIAFLAIWIYLYGYLSGMNIAQIYACCLIQMIFLLTKRKTQCSTLFIFFPFCLALLVLIDLILIIINVISQTDPFTQQILMFLTVVFTFKYSYYENKIMTNLSIMNIMILNEVIRRYLLENYQDEENNQQKVERIQSIDSSQIDPVYGKNCTICSDECGLQEKVVQLKCLHIFHSECIRKWLLQQRYCPNCRDQVF